MFISILLSLAFFFKNYKMYKSIKVNIISTSIVGAYVTIRSLSLLIGGWPDEESIAEYIHKDAWDAINNHYWIYFILVIIVSVLGSVI